MTTPPIFANIRACLPTSETVGPRGFSTFTAWFESRVVQVSLVEVPRPRIEGITSPHNLRDRLAKAFNNLAKNS